jgi:hypothetical protein
MFLVIQIFLWAHEIYLTQQARSTITKPYHSTWHEPEPHFSTGAMPIFPIRLFYLVWTGFFTYFYLVLVLISFRVSVDFFVFSKKPESLNFENFKFFKNLNFFKYKYIWKSEHFLIFEHFYNLNIFLNMNNFFKMIFFKYSNFEHFQILNFFHIWTFLFTFWTFFLHFSHI